jgi:S-adenosyl methyltransferase
VTYYGDWRTTFRPDIPSAARVYDNLLGGKDNYPADRAVAESMIAQLPNVQLAVQWNRAFLRRVVRYPINQAGIRQIIDIGAGLPTAGNTHEIARDACPQTRVVYVDHDPVVLAHARSMLHGVPNTTIIAQDLLAPDEILADPMLRSLIDFSEPTAVLFLSILHFVSDAADPAMLTARLLDPFPPVATWRSRTPRPMRCRQSATWSGSSTRRPSRPMSAAGPRSASSSPGWRSSSPDWSGRPSGGRTPATTYRPTRPSRITAWWSPGSRDRRSRAHRQEAEASARVVRISARAAPWLL